MVFTGTIKEVIEFLSTQDQDVQTVVHFITQDSVRSIIDNYHSDDVVQDDVDEVAERVMGALSDDYIEDVILDHINEKISESIQDLESEREDE